MKPRYLPAAATAALIVIAGAAAFISARDPQTAAQPDRGRDGTVTIARRDFVRVVRLSGTVEAVQSTTVAAPRLSGPSSNSLVVMKLVRPGTRVKPGDLLVEFDRQDQLKNALDRRAELTDLEQQILKKDAEGRAARAKDDSELQQAQSALSRAELEMVKNPMIAKIQAEKNEQALEEAQAKLKQLKTTYDLKRLAAEADLRVLQIRRSKAESAMRQAEGNATRMEIHSPIEGLAVIRTVWKSNAMSEIQEGEEVRAGVPVVDIVNPAMMRVRTRVNQADINGLRVDQPVKVGLDAYPDLFFGGRVAQISPIAVTSTLNPKVRNFVVLIDVNGSHANLMPDLTASLDVELGREQGALVVPRDALRYEGDRAFVRVRRGEDFEDRAVTVGTTSAHEAVVTGGLEEGAVVARNVGSRTGS
jgi:multidrug efflux pump subunit AcrA (membrane-fusion protein)